MSSGNRPLDAAVRDPWARDAQIAIAIAILALLVRLPLMGQGMWLDEAGTVRHWATRPVRDIVAADDYAPNNQTLHTLLVKASLKVGSALGVITADSPGRGTFTEGVARAPAAIAGSLVGVALAWPLRRRRPVYALAVALVVSLHPWLVAFSTEARGYSLVLLLAVLATNLLPDGAAPTKAELLSRRGLGYALCAALAMYTVPIALVVFVGHGVTMFLLRRRGFAAWLGAASIGAALTLLLYAPMLSAMMRYFREPFPATLRFREMLDQLPRFALAGDNLPGVTFILLPLMVLTAGSVLAWQREILRPALVTFGTAAVLAVLIAAVSQPAREVRFVPWLIPVVGIAFVAVFTPTGGQGKPIGLIAALLLFGTWAGVRVWSFAQVPVQPLRDAAQWVEKNTSPADAIACVNYAGPEALWAYSRIDMSRARQIGSVEEWAASATPPPATAPATQPAAFVPTEPWALVPYPELTRRRHPKLWAMLEANYAIEEHFPGRLEPTVIYRRRELPLTLVNP